MNNREVDDLVEALKRAQQAAIDAKGTDDSGSANLDSVAICLLRWRKVKIKKASELSGIKIDLVTMSSLMWRNCRFVHFHTDGQASMNTRMVEAAAKSLKDDGYDARVRYKVD